MCSCKTPKYICSCAVKAASMVTNDIYLTTAQLDTLRSEIEYNFANSQDWFNDMRYGIVNKSSNYRRDLLLLSILFTYWSQHSDGTTTGLTNYITRQEFSKAVNKARRIVAGTIIA